MAVTIGLTAEQLDSWGWRLPFVFGLLIAPVGIYIRRHIEEPAEFVARKRSTASPSLLAMLAGNLRGVLVTFGLIICGTITVYYGPLSTAVAEQFEPGVRSTGLSLAYNLAVMLFGGFAQFFVTFMIDFTGDPLAAAYYVMFGCAVGLVAACFVREPAHTT